MLLSELQHPASFTVLVMDIMVLPLFLLLYLHLSQYGLHILLHCSFLFLHSQYILVFLIFNCRHKSASLKIKLQDTAKRNASKTNIINISRSPYYSSYSKTIILYVNWHIDQALVGDTRSDSQLWNCWFELTYQYKKPIQTQYSLRSPEQILLQHVTTTEPERDESTTL